MQLIETLSFSRRKLSKPLLVMKLILMFMVVCSVQLTASVYSQNTKLNIELKNKSLVDVFKEIRNNSEFTFVYDMEDVEGIWIESANYKEVHVEKILDDCLSNTTLTYQVIDNVVILKQAPPKPNVPQQPETITITGKVTDEQGQPLPFVNIYIKGDTKGVITDQEGKYSITVEEKEGMVMVASFIGFVTKEFEVAGRTEINLMLKGDIADLNEVVVTGYQTLSKERASGSFEKVDAEALAQRATFDIMDKLEGQTSGVLFDENGNIMIRGISTMNASTQPLIVVDGFPIEGDIENLNPNDIESMTILKDAAAASIWGARASNGVVVIVSKKGKEKGKVNIDFSSTLSITPEPDLYSLRRASTESFLEFEKHLADNEWKELPSPWAISKPAFNEGLDTYLRYNDEQMTEAERDAVINRFKGVDVRDEYADLFLRRAVRQQYHLSISGANEKSNYYASISYDDNDAWQKGVDNDRLVSNLRIQTKLSDRVSFNAAISATIRNKENNGAPDLSTLASYQRILDENGDYIAQPWIYAQEGKDAHAATNNVPYDWTYNAFQEFENKDNSTQNIDLRMQAGLNVQLLKGLDFEGRYQYEWGNAKAQSIYNEETYYVRDQVNMYAYPEVDAWTGQTVMQYPIPMGEARSDASSYSKSFTSRAQLNFNRNFEGKHQVYAIGGVEFRQTENESSNLTKYGYDPVSLQYKRMNYDTEYQRAFSYWPSKLSDATVYAYEKNRYASYYGNAGYTYNERYTITGSARLDDSNLFGASKKYRNTPLWSVGANWQMHKEDFMASDIINRLTFRATYGTGGNIDRSTSPYLTAAVTSDWQTQHQFAYIANPKNPNLRWEKTKTANIGVDYALWGNKLSGSIEYYNRQSVDLLGNVSLNAIYGFDSAKMNFAEMSNKGIDLSVNVGVINKEVKWNINTTFSYNKNNVEEVELADESVAGAINYWGSSSARVGKPLNHLYSYRWAGLSEAGLPQVYNEKGEIIDHNTPMEEVEGLKYEGTTTPRYYGSLQNVVSYKGVRLSMLITYKLGHKFRVPTVDYSDLKNSYTINIIHEDYEGRWQQAGDENVTDIPVMPEDPNVIGGYWKAYSLYGSHNVESASHIRFKDIVLSYDLPKNWFKPLGVKSLNIGAQVRNLGVITFNDADMDPENIIGVSGYGKVRPEYTFSLKARF